jgi:hypothetical protein
MQQQQQQQQKPQQHSSSSSGSGSFRWTPGKESNLDKFKKEAELAQSHILGDKASSLLGTNANANVNAKVGSQQTSESVTTTGTSSSSSLTATDLILKDFPHLQSLDNSRLVNKLRKRETQLIQKQQSEGQQVVDILVIKQKLIEMLEKKTGSHPPSAAAETQTGTTEMNVVENEKMREKPVSNSRENKGILVKPISASSSDIGRNSGSGSGSGTTLSTVVGQTSADSFPTVSNHQANHVAEIGTQQQHGHTEVGSGGGRESPILRTVSGQLYSADSRSTKPGLPPLPYHDQALRNYSAFRPYIPTYEGAKAEG